MELYLDSVDFNEVHEAVSLGFLEGITTTPTFMHRHGIKDVDQAIVDLSHLARHVHVEALGDTCEQILEEAQRIDELDGVGDSLVFKIPVTNEGLKAEAKLAAKGKKTNIHLVYTLNQAYLAAAAGATYICPLVGRLHDQGHDSFALIEQSVEMVEKYGYSTKIMVSSVRHPDHVRMGILCRAHAATIPWKVMKILADNVLTGHGIALFDKHTKLTTYTVGQVIRDANPKVSPQSNVAEASIEMTKSDLGVVSVVDHDGVLIGVFTDGDLRRATTQYQNLSNVKMEELMVKNPKTVNQETILQEAVDTMHEGKIDNLIVVDQQNRPVGVIDVQDLLEDGLF